MNAAQTHYTHDTDEGLFLGRVCILGLGKSGTDTALFCLDNPEICTGLVIYTGGDTQQIRESAAPFMARGVEVVFGLESIEGHFDTCLASPGISANSAFYKSGEEHSDLIMSEPELAFRVSPGRWVGITGTNGKTTTTALTTHLLNTAGIEARSVGNIGDPCIAAAASRKSGEYLVAELSSYQLASTHTFSPDVAVLLNITPDHLSWHGSHEAYTAAKMKLFAHLSEQAMAVFDGDDEGAATCARALETPASLLLIDARAHAPREGYATCADGMLGIWPRGGTYTELCRFADMHLAGAHNVVNALAAAAAALHCGADAPAISAGLLSFTALEHRIEPVGSAEGVSYFNDSKATNTDAVEKALTAFTAGKLIVLLGGRDKGTDLSSLVEACSQVCRGVVCFGEARERFLEAFDGADGLELMSADHLADALETARGFARPGDTVLLSPACASFDEFSCFEERGDSFKALVSALDGFTRD